jgi:hypothetical protein
MVLDEKSDQSVKVKILNGTNVPGLAKKMRNILMREGLHRGRVSAPSYPFFARHHHNQRADTDYAMRVAEILGVDRVYHIIDSSQLNAHSSHGKDYVK